MAWIWARNIPHRIKSIPWQNIFSEAVGRCFLVAKFACFIHVTNNYVCGVALVHGPSMLPTLNLSGDVLLVDRLSSLLGNISIGDIVLIQSPEDPRKIVTKRVTGVEGDSISFTANPVRGEGSLSTSLVVPRDHLWVTGDNPFLSRDSRHFGPVPYALIKGRAFCRVWPPEEFGVLGKEE